MPNNCKICEDKVLKYCFGKLVLPKRDELFAIIFKICFAEICFAINNLHFGKNAKSLYAITGKKDMLCRLFLSFAEVGNDEYHKNTDGVCQEIEPQKALSQDEVSQSSET